ncbi:MAG: hypothetical protein J6V54_04230 [Bacteroidales bacterium]|nr:hypothetical protein [Bacteroidales bacterium]
MKKVFLKTVLLALVTVGCVSATTLGKKKEKDERLKPFVGTIIGTEECGTGAYLINFISPDSIGNEVYICGNRYYNVVKTYSISLDSLKIGDTISGTFMPDTSSLIHICDGNTIIYGVHKKLIINLK